MRVSALPTEIVKPGDDLFEVLEDSLLMVPERSVLIVTSKILSICEQRVVEIIGGDKAVKHDLVRQEADWYLDPEESEYNLMLTVKNNQLIVNAGIDESNVDDQYVMWPGDPQEWANEIWEWLRASFEVEQVGVIITDSKTTPLIKGVTGTALAHAGFNALRSLIGMPDIFGRQMKVTEVNLAQALAVAGVLEMGEGNEQTPLALIEDVHEIEYQNRVPTVEELALLRFDLQQDLFAPILTKANWKKGRK